VANPHLRSTGPRFNVSLLRAGWENLLNGRCWDLRKPEREGVREYVHAARGVLLPLTFSASLLALSLSNDVDTPGTKLIPNSLSLLTLGPTDLSYFPLAVAGQGRLPGILLCLCVVSLVCACSCALALSCSLK